MLALVSPRASSTGPLDARLLSTLYLDPCTNNFLEHKHLSCDTTLFCIISYFENIFLFSTQSAVFGDFVSV